MALDFYHAYSAYPGRDNIAHVAHIGGALTGVAAWWDMWDPFVILLFRVDDVLEKGVLLATRRSQPIAEMDWHERAVGLDKVVSMLARMIVAS